MAERIADYCDAVLTIESLCKPGYKCCVSRDAFGDSPPPELQVIDRTNSSRYDEKKGDGSSSKISFSSTTTQPNTSLSTSISALSASATTMTATMTASTKQPTTTVSTVATTFRPKPIPKPCKGECTSDLSALFCNNIDGEAECPADGSVLTVCCINEPPPPPPKTVIESCTFSA